MKNYLDKLAQAMGTKRKFYGADKEYQPNSHCCWVEGGAILAGWYEKDHHLKERLNKKARSIAHEVYRQERLAG